MTNKELIKNYARSVGMYSLMDQMARGDLYESIIARGNEIVPDLLLHLRDESGSVGVMVCLMNITRVMPYKPKPAKAPDGRDIPGWASWKMKECRQAWLDWGIGEGLISENTSSPSPARS